MKVFISLGKPGSDDDNPCYINAFNIDYIYYSVGRSKNKTTIRFKGSENQINTDISTKEVVRRITAALDDFENRKIKEEISRASLMDLEE